VTTNTRIKKDDGKRAFFSMKGPKSGDTGNNKLQAPNYK
jgi:hypothetical protein